MPSIFMTSLGCVKNLVDTETILGETLGKDCTLETDPDRADILIINTCGFIEDARRESRDAIQWALELKAASGGRVKAVVMGCLAQRFPDRIREEFPDVDAIWGLSAPSDIGQALAELIARPEPTRVQGLEPRSVVREGARLVSTGPSYAYLRIADGCDNRCRYCAIPLIRGGLQSRKPEAVVEEALSLERLGARELVVIAQDITAYGADWAPRPESGFADLVRRLLAALAVPRLRLLYAHPAHLDDATIDLLLHEPRLCRYIDVPLQHVSDRMLAAMGRGYGKDRVLDLLARFARPGFTLRTTLMVGFPGETEADFLEMLDLVKTGCFQHMGAFAYSPEPGTPAHGDPGAVPAEEAGRRLAALMEAQAEATFAWLDSRVGGIEPLLVDGVAADRGALVARGEPDAPDADGVVYIQDPDARPGDLVNACIYGREGYDLLARPPAAAARRGQGAGGRRGAPRTGRHGRGDRNTRTSRGGRGGARGG